MSYFILWILFTLPAIDYALLPFVYLSTVALTLFAYVWVSSYDDNDGEPGLWSSPGFKKLIKGTAYVLICCVALRAMIPSEKQLAMIVAGGATYNVLTSEPAQQLGGKGLTLLNEYLDEKIAEFQKDEKK